MNAAFDLIWVSRRWNSQNWSEFSSSISDWDVGRLEILYKSFKKYQKV
jgi:hypothetical protein